MLSSNEPSADSSAKTTMSSSDSDAKSLINSLLPDVELAALITKYRSSPPTEAPTSGNKLFIKDLASESDELVVVFADETADGSLLESNNGYLLIETNRDAPKGRVIALDPQAAGETDWRDVIPESKHVLNASSSAG